MTRFVWQVTPPPLTPPEGTPTLPLSPPVQDNLVARVLLEHVHPDPPPPPRDPHRAVNYLDLSRLGEEGETPARSAVTNSILFY